MRVTGGMRDRRLIRLLGSAAAVAPALLSALAAIALWIAAFGFAAGLPIAYLPVILVVWFVANHFLEIIEHKASGNSDWPAFSIETIAGGRQQMGLLFIAAVVLAGLALRILAAVDQAAVASLLAWLVALSLPAVTALLAVTRNPLRALNPRGIASAAVRLGADYILLLLATGGAMAALRIAYERRGFIELFIGVYAVLLVAYLTGSVVYDRRIALGVHAPRSPEAKLEAQNNRLIKERSSVLDHAYGFAASGNVKGALEHIDRYARTESEPLNARVWMFYQMVHWENGGPALDFGNTLASELGAGERHDEAAKVLLACRYLEERVKQTTQTRPFP
jgi:hypothetical protein